MSHENAVRWMEASSRLLDGVVVPAGLRNRVSISLFHLCMEHQQAICVLFGVGNVSGSAFALIRPQFEAYVRGLWFFRCATDKKIESFLNGNDPPKINVLIREIETTPRFKHGNLMQQKINLWKHLNDYTHGGAVQVKARNNNNDIVNNYSEKHINWALDKTADISLLAALEMSEIAENENLSKELIHAHREIYRRAP